MAEFTQGADTGVHLLLAYDLLDRLLKKWQPGCESLVL